MVKDGSVLQEMCKYYKWIEIFRRSIIKRNTQKVKFSVCSWPDKTSCVDSDPFSQLWLSWNLLSPLLKTLSQCTSPPTCTQQVLYLEWLLCLFWLEKHPYKTVQIPFRYEVLFSSRLAINHMSPLSCRTVLTVSTLSFYFSGSLSTLRPPTKQGILLTLFLLP